MRNKKKTVKQPVRSGSVAKVPVIIQMEALECGAACLAMVLAYYNKWVPLEQCRSDCGVSRDGSNAKNCVNAAINYGMEVHAFKMEPQALKEEGTFPCIVHWNFNHFIVVDGIRGDKVYVNDPARGALNMSMSDFDRGFTGVALFFKPGPKFEPSGEPVSMLKYALSRLKQSKGAMAIVILTTLAGALVGIIRPIFSRIFYDRLIVGKNQDWMIPFLIGLTVFAVIQIVLAWVDAISSNRINGKLAAIGNTSFLWKVLHLPMEFFSQRMAGDVQQRQSTNASIANTLINTFTPLVLETIMMVVYLVLMLRYSVLLTLIGIGSIAINFLISTVISAKRVNVVRVQTRDAGKLSGTTIAGIEMIETIKSSGAENGFFEKWSGYQASANAQGEKYMKIDTYIGLIPSIVSALADISVVLIGVMLTIQGHFTVGMITSFQGFLSSFMSPAETLISAGQTLQELRTDMERVEDVMSYPDDPVFKKELSGEPVSYSKLTGNIELKNVTFGYSKLAEPLIRDFNLTLTPGRHVAFVGASGCGKSTISKLISGLYQPWSGEILYDGKPISRIDRSVFTGSLAVVDQDIILFEDTIANNIKMWDKSIEDFEMIMAARDAQIHNSIIQREGGYQHVLCEGGKDFSGGERQRLEIARVLAQDPTIIIMDEATSALDAKTEYDVVKCIKDRGIACIVVAHRLSTIRDCDEIIVLDKGVVVERGTHDELMALDGYYTKLVTSD